MILVTGATGNVGNAVVANLISSGAKVRGLVRDEQKARSLKVSGAEVVMGDLAHSETLDAAFRGVEKVFLLTPIGPNATIQASNGIAAAKRAGGPHVVRLSAIKAAFDSPTRISRLHAETDTELRASGLPYTILKPHFFMQNTMMAAQTVASDGAIYMPFKSGRVGMVDIRDIGEVAAKVLTSPGHEGETYSLTGPQSISFHDVATTLSEALSRKVTYVDVPVAAARESMLGMGIPGWAADGFGEYFTAFSEGYGDLTTDDVERVMGNPARAFQAFARDFAGIFEGTQQAA